MTYYHPLTNVDPENCQCLEQSSLLTSTIGRVHVSWRVYLIALYKKHKKTHKQNHEFHLFLGQTRMFAYLSSHSFSMNTKFPIVFSIGFFHIFGIGMASAGAAAICHRCASWRASGRMEKDPLRERISCRRRPSGCGKLCFGRGTKYSIIYKLMII